MVAAPLRVLALALPYWVIAAPVRADVLVVGSGGPFTTIQAAVDAAQDGDTLLVEPGSYAKFQVTNKSLDIVGEDPVFGYVSVGGGSTISGLGLGKSVLLQNLHIEAISFATLNGISLIGNLGAVRVESCTFSGSNNPIEPPNCWFSPPNGGIGVVVQNCLDVVFVDCGISGGNGWVQSRDCYEYYGSDGGRGMQSTSSSVALYNCDVRGGFGGDGQYSGKGGDAYFLGSGPKVLFSRSVFEGGAAGLSYNDFLNGVSGGNGISGAALFGMLIDVEVTGGKGGWPNGADGQALTFPTAFIQESGPGRLLAVDTPVRVGEPFLLALHGEPSDLAILVLSGQDAPFQILPEFHGALLTGPSVTLGAWFLGPQGKVTLPLLLGPLLGSPESLTVVLQSIHLSPTFEWVLGASRHLVVLDQAF